MSAYAASSDEYMRRMALTYGTVIQHVEDVALERGFRKANGTLNVARLAAETGISTATFYYMFKRPDTFRQLNLVTLAKLCKVLRCGVGDLFEYVPGLNEDSLGIDTSFLTNLKGAR